MIPPSAEQFWEMAPCGHVIAQLNGRILRANTTLARWLGYDPDALRGKSFSDLLTVSGRILYDTHFGPLLRMGGDLNGVTVDLQTAEETRLPMFLTANVVTGTDGKPEFLQITILDGLDRRAYEAELRDARRLAEQAQLRAEALAGSLRRSLLPPVLSPPAGLEAADFYSNASADDVGGDFYDLFPLSATTSGFFLGDVAGKGVDAAVVTGLTRYALRAAAVYDDDPVAVLTNLNAVLRQHFGNEGIRMCTLIYGVLTKRHNGFEVSLASGGHPPPVLFCRDGSAYYVDTNGGQAAGILAKPRFVANRFHLAPGDTLLLYTDGLTEASTGVGRRRYDDEGALLRFAKSHSPTTPAAIVDAIRRLLDNLGAGVEDDTAVLALGVART
ncbi:MAG: SpoIIE family protein phosphatase [Mycobacterium sp.]